MGYSIKKAKEDAAKARDKINSISPLPLLPTAPPKNIKELFAPAVPTTGPLAPKTVAPVSKADVDAMWDNWGKPAKKAVAKTVAPAKKVTTKHTKDKGFRDALLGGMPTPKTVAKAVAPAKKVAAKAAAPVKKITELKTPTAKAMNVPNPVAGMKNPIAGIQNPIAGIQNPLAGILGGPGGGMNTGGFLGGLGGGQGGPLGGIMQDGQTPWDFFDPGNYFHDKPNVDTAGEKPSMPPDTFVSAATPEGRLGDPYTVSAGPAGKSKVNVSAGNVITAPKALKSTDYAANKVALNAMRDRATAVGDSPWLTMQKQLQGQEELGLRDAAARQSLSGAATARNQLAMNGGLQSGARERIAMNTQRDLNAQRQGIGRQGVSDRLSLGIADDTQKMGLLGQTVSADTQRAQQIQDLGKFNNSMALDTDRTNAANALTASQNNAAFDMQGQQFNSNAAMDASRANAAMSAQQLQDANRFKLGVYGEDMKGWAAAKTADGTANAGKK